MQAQGTNQGSGGVREKSQAIYVASLKQVSHPALISPGENGQSNEQGKIDV